MGETRGYEASAERLARARSRFGRPGSRELSSAALLGALAIGLPGVGTALWLLSQQLWTGALAAAQSPIAAAPRSVVAALPTAASASLLAQGVGLVSALLLAGWGATLVQRGGWLRALSGQPGDGFGDARSLPQLTAAERFVTAALTLVKWLLVTVLLLWPLVSSAPGLIGAWDRTPAELLSIVTRTGAELLARAALLLGLVGAVDLGIQHWLFRRRLRMSRSQWQQERRASEADPQLVEERRRRAQALRARATQAELSETALVVSGGDDLLLGLRRDAAGLLILWIKAEGELAQQLMAAARARAIPLHSDRALASQLLRLEIGEQPARPEAELLSRLLGPAAGGQELGRA